MPTSTVPASQEDLVELLDDALGSSDLHVAFQGSGKLPKVHELVIVLPARDYSRSPGEQFMVEAYDLAVRFEIFKPGEFSAQDADTRRWELVDAVDAALRENDYRGYATRGGDVGTTGESLDPYVQGWVAKCVATYSIETFLQG